MFKKAHPSSKEDSVSVKRVNELIRPAFASNIQAFCFLVLIIFALTLPVIITKSGLITRRNSYQIMPESQGAYTFIENEVFNKKDDIDILFIGGSVIWNAIDTPQVQKSLSEKIGRPAEVVTFGVNFNSTDIPYMQLRDLLERRRVRMVVFSVPRLPYTNGPSTTAYKFLRYEEHSDVIEGLPLESKFSLYAANVLRSPRDLLTIIRENRSRPSPYTENLGANKEILGMNRKPDKFERFTPPSPVFSSADLIYSSLNHDSFQFTNEELSLHQDYYLGEFVKLLKAKQVSLVFLNIPQYTERLSPKIVERCDWSKKFNSDIPLIGVAPTVLFAGLNEKEVENLHCDPNHFNMNGNEFFTRAITPAILDVYEKNAAKNY